MKQSLILKRRSMATPQKINVSVMTAVYDFIFDLPSFTEFVTLWHCVKSVHIRRCSGPYFPAFGLNTERYSASLRIQSECGKIRSRITPNMDTFYALWMPNVLRMQYRSLYFISSSLLF